MQHNIPPLPATRERLPGEIIPESATQSGTYNDNEDQYGAEHAIDLDPGTHSRTTAGLDDTLWLQLKLDHVYCVEEVQEYYSNGSARRTWTCNSSNCSSCEGSNCGSYIRTVSTEEAVKYPVLNCKYGDTVKLEYIGKDHDSFKVHEIAVTGKKGEIIIDSSGFT